MKTLEALVESVRRRYAPEPRTAIFEVRIETRDGTLAVTGMTTEPGALDELLRQVRPLAAGRPVIDEAVRLPHPSLGDRTGAVVRAGTAPVHAAPDVRATQVSQYVLGARLELLLAAGRWLRVRGEDGYLAWVNRGYLEMGTPDWAARWETAAGTIPAVSLGAELVDERGAPVLHLPWGARLGRAPDGACVLPDGRAARLATGELVSAADIPRRFPPDGDAIAASARAWIGAPYLWGGVTMAGVDCSGFVQSLFRLHGVRLRRDAELQRAHGLPVDPGPDFAGLRPGDLLFFTEVPGRVTHVALSVGGTRIIHSALSNGGVAENDLAGGGELQPALRRMFLEARRPLADV